jgi:hypothetical protein
LRARLDRYLRARALPETVAAFHDVIFSICWNRLRANLPCPANPCWNGLHEPANPFQTQLLCSMHADDSISSMPTFRPIVYWKKLRIDKATSTLYCGAELAKFIVEDEILGPESVQRYELVSEAENESPASDVEFEFRGTRFIFMEMRP